MIPRDIKDTLVEDMMGLSLEKKINWKTVKKDRLLGVLADSARSLNACYTNEVCLVATWLSAM